MSSVPRRRGMGLQYVSHRGVGSKNAQDLNQSTFIWDCRLRATAHHDIHIIHRLTVKIYLLVLYYVVTKNLNPHSVNKMELLISCQHLTRCIIQIKESGQ